MTVIKVYPDRDYTTLHNNNIWDENLSNETIGFWVRCVSMKPDWDFYITELAKRMKCSKKSIYKHIKILEAHRYCIRLVGYEKDGKKFSKKVVKYIFFMKPFSIEDQPALVEKLKKCYGSAHFGNFHDGNLPGESLEKKNKNKEEIIEKNKQKDETSADASALCDFLLAKIKEKKPNFSGQVSTSWLKDANKLLKMRSLEELKRIIEFMVADDFFGQWTFSMAKILKHLDAAETKMNANKKSSKKVLSHQVIEQRKQWAKLNEWVANGGYASAEEDGYVINGQEHKYDSDSEFWRDLNL